jgi:hypothetical protein
MAPSETPRTNNAASYVRPSFMNMTYVLTSTVAASTCQASSHRLSSPVRPPGASASERHSPAATSSSATNTSVGPSVDT